MDLKKAFDNVNWAVMFQMLKRVDVYYTDRMLRYKLYQNEMAVIKIGHNEEEASIEKGMDKDYVLSCQSYLMPTFKKPQNQ